MRQRGGSPSPIEVQMSTMLTALSQGQLGVTLSFPDDFEILSDDATEAQLVDSQGQVTWWAFFFEGLFLDLSPHHFDTLRRDVENHTRFLFDLAFTTTDLPDRSPGNEPRTSDPTWSPLIEVEPLALDGSPALHVIHRVHYEPGLETEVPIAEGRGSRARELRHRRRSGGRRSRLRVHSTAAIHLRRSCGRLRYRDLVPVRQSIVHRIRGNRPPASSGVPRARRRRRCAGVVPPRGRACTEHSRERGCSRCRGSR